MKNIGILMVFVFLSSEAWAYRPTPTTPLKEVGKVAAVIGATIAGGVVLASGVLWYPIVLIVDSASDADQASDLEDRLRTSVPVGQSLCERGEGLDADDLGSYTAFKILRINCVEGKGLFADNRCTHKVNSPEVMACRLAALSDASNKDWEVDVDDGAATLFDQHGARMVKQVKKRLGR